MAETINEILTQAASVVYNMDCMEGMAQYPDKYFDLAVVDPPYGIGFKYNEYDDTEDNLKNIISKAIPEIRRISKRAVIFANHQKIFLYPMPDWMLCYSWDTTASYGMLGYCQWQPVLFYGKDIKGFGSVNNVIKSDMMRFSGGGALDKGNNTNHPCPKPLKVIKKIIQRFSDCDRMKIIDPFLGSGTTRIAARDLGHDFTGYEIDKDYYEAQEKRFIQHIAQTRLF